LESFRFLSDPQTVSEQERTFLSTFLTKEARLGKHKRIEYLMRKCGIKLVKRLSDFDWTFHPEIPRDKIMEFVHTQWLKQPSNLVLIGPAGVGKTHLATVLCYEVIFQGHQTVLLSLFDLTAKLTKARNLYSLIDYYAKIPILCFDELG
jgi:DNA replication protein DnaC